MMEKRNSILVSFLALCACFWISTGSARAIDFNIADPNSYNAVIGGAQANVRLGRYNIGYANFDNDGKDDIILTEFSSPYSIYIILGSQFDGSIEQVLDTNEITDFYLRYSPANANEYNSYYTSYGSDLDGNGRDELIIANDSSSEAGVTNRGSVYIIYDSILSGYSGTGNSVALSDPSTWNIKLLGASADDHLGSSFYAKSDLNRDQLPDLVVTSLYTDYAFADAGSAYILHSSLLNTYQSSTGNYLSMSSASNYHFRIDGPLANSGILAYSFGDTHDYDNDNFDDVLLMVAATDFAEPGSGSYYLLSNALLNGYSGTGTILELSNSSDFNLRFDSPEADSSIGYTLVSMGDVNNNGKTDLALTASYGSNAPDTADGAIFLIYDDIFDDLTGTGNTLSLLDTNNYTVKYTGKETDISLGESTWFGDYTNDGKLDLLTHDYYNVYVLDNALLSGYTDTGNTVELGTADTYSYKFYNDASIFITSYTFADFNGDGSKDFVMDALNSTFLGRTNADGNFIVFNFPHTITLEPSRHVFSSNTATIVGIVTGQNSTTTVSNVLYQVDSQNRDTSGWANCTPLDGSFNSSSEEFSCFVSALGPGTHTIYIKAMDEKGTYTPLSGYQPVVVTVSETGSVAAQALPPQCHAFRPSGTPELFQIDTTKSTASLFFSPVRGNTDSYYIRYGTTPTFLEHGYSFPYRDSSGVIMQKINHLQPNTTYYFQVRAGNSCMPGNWGNTLTATTTTQSRLQKFFLYLRAPKLR
ncbi:hypothetical protein KBD71_03255 [Candidatus Woesebacteria bacterium]|nr:hypothetical protein [Candidatus Woesebacteria bacterium]